MNEVEEFYKGAGQRYAERGVAPDVAAKLLDQHMQKIADFVGIGAPPEPKPTKKVKPADKNIVPMPQRAI